jgi:hypothetical protein
MQNDFTFALVSQDFTERNGGGDFLYACTAIVRVHAEE